MTFAIKAEVDDPRAEGRFPQLARPDGCMTRRPLQSGEVFVGQHATRDFGNRRPSLQIRVGRIA